MRTCLVGMTTCLLAGCNAYLPRYALPAETAPTGFYKDPNHPNLALLEYRLARYFDQKQPPYPTVCAIRYKLDFADAESQPVPFDPHVEQALLTRFPGLSPASQCKREGVRIVDRETGAAATVFDVHDMVCDTATKCSAWTGYYGAGPHGWSWYWLIWNGREWQIRRREMDIVLT